MKRRQGKTLKGIFCGIALIFFSLNGMAEENIDWKEQDSARRKEMAEEIYDIKMDKGGSLLNYVPIKDIEYVKSLKVTGVLYESDIAVIRDMKQLEVLDLENAFVTVSPEYILKETKGKKNLSNLMSLLSAQADISYNNKQISKTDYTYSKLMTELLKPQTPQTKSYETCMVYGFERMSNLREVVLPKFCKKIKEQAFYGCEKLEKVELPKHLEVIEVSAFGNTRSLKSIEIPSTLKELGSYSFYHSGIINFDLTNTQIESLSFIDLVSCNQREAYNNPDFRMIINMPNKLKKFYGGGENGNVEYATIYFPSTLELVEADFRRCKLHFKSTTAPDIYNLCQCSIYCPKGSITSYYAKHRWANSRPEYLTREEAANNIEEE